MSTLGLPDKRRYTHLQRAFKVFERMRPQLLSARALAAVMQTEIETAYNYIKRLKDARCIEPKGGTGKVPLYGLKDDAQMPADDARGRKPRQVLEPEIRGGSSLELQDEEVPMCATGAE